MNMPTCDRCGFQSATEVLSRSQSVSVGVPDDLPGGDSGTPVPMTVLTGVSFNADLCSACAALVTLLFTSALSQTSPDDARGLAQAGQDAVASSLRPQAVLDLLR